VRNRNGWNLDAVLVQRTEMPATIAAVPAAAPAGRPALPPAKPLRYRRRRPGGGFPVAATGRVPRSAPPFAATATPAHHRPICVAYTLPVRLQALRTSKRLAAASGRRGADRAGCDCGPARPLAASARDRLQRRTGRGWLRRVPARPAAFPRDMAYWRLKLPVNRWGKAPRTSTGHPFEAGRAGRHHLVRDDGVHLGMKHQSPFADLAGGS